MADFLLKIANFRCHGNKGVSEPNMTSTVELVDPENIPLNQKLRLYLIYNRNYGNFSGEIHNFSLPWQQGSSEQSLTDTIKSADLENPLVGATIWGDLLHKLNYGRFSVENRKFSLPWQQGCVRAKYD